MSEDRFTSRFLALVVLRLGEGRRGYEVDISKVPIQARLFRKGGRATWVLAHRHGFCRGQ